MPLIDLQVNGLYVVLFTRTSPHTLSTFHWGLYLHFDGKKGGNKYHIKQLGSGWIVDHGEAASVFKSFLLIGLFQIATIPTGLEGHVDQQLRSYDSSLNSLPNLTCRTWLFRVLALLQKEVNGYKLLKCADLDALEAEIMGWGNENAWAANENVQPRPVGVSKYVQG